MTQPIYRPSGEPRVWSPPIVDDEDDQRGRERTETGPLPTIESGDAPPMSDGTKIAIGSGGVFALLALIDKALSGTGMTAADVAERLGPALGALYNSSPVVVVLLFLGGSVLRIYKREQDTHRRRDKRMQRQLAEIGTNLTGEIGMLRDDVNGFAEALDRVRQDIELKIEAQVGLVTRAASDHAARTAQAIADLQRGQSALEQQVRETRARIDVVEREQLASLADAPTMQRRARPGGRTQ